jgi:hypothetical protein
MVLHLSISCLVVVVGRGPMTGTLAVDSGVAQVVSGQKRSIRATTGEADDA